MVILKGDPDNLKEIGHCFEELKKIDKKLDELLSQYSTRAD